MVSMCSVAVELLHILRDSMQGCSQTSDDIRTLPLKKRRRKVERRDSECALMDALSEIF